MSAINRNKFFSHEIEFSGDYNGIKILKGFDNLLAPVLNEGLKEMIEKTVARLLTEFFPKKIIHSDKYPDIKNIRLYRHKEGYHNPELMHIATLVYDHSYKVFNAPNLSDANEHVIATDAIRNICDMMQKKAVAHNAKKRESSIEDFNASFDEALARIFLDPTKRELLANRLLKMNKLEVNTDLKPIWESVKRKVGHDPIYSLLNKEEKERALTAIYARQIIDMFILTEIRNK
jgi:hypothetical protein